MPYVFGELKNGGIRICKCGEVTLEDEMHWHDGEVPVKCHVCGKGPADGTTVFRQNEKGVAGIWACEEHSVSVDLAVQVDVAIIEETLKNDS